MEFRVLGQLEAWRADERLPLGSFKQRSLLALLLIHANHAIASDQIIDELWGDAAGSDHHNALWVLVSRLRTVLEPERERRAEGGVLETRTSGYSVSIGAEDLDSVRFERLVHEGRDLLGVDPRAAAVVLGEALALWRGRPYEDFTYESFAQAEILRLDELRLEGVELRIEADLRRGVATELVGELKALVRQHPFRERFAAQLMLALYRSGRRAEALRAYAHLQATLGNELGLDPSPELQSLEHQILTSAPEVDMPATAVASSRPFAIRGYELRERICSHALGTTYRAYQAAEGREVSITVVAPDRINDVAFIRRLQIDPEIMASLVHPSILTVEDFWREPDGAYLVTRVFNGDTLAEETERGVLAADGATRVAADVDAALSAARDRGFVHVGVDPSSILVEDGRGILHGFGFVPEPLQHGVGVPPLEETDVLANDPRRSSGRRRTRRRTRTRGWRRSVRPTPVTSSVESASSNACWLGSAPSAALGASWRSSGRAEAASRASSRPGSCRPSATVLWPVRLTGSSCRWSLANSPSTSSRSRSVRSP